jgi:hypothetical protein
VKFDPMLHLNNVKALGNAVRMSQESSSVCESSALPVFRQLGQTSLSIHWSRILWNMRPTRPLFQSGTLPQSN